MIKNYAKIFSLTAFAFVTLMSFSGQAKAATPTVYYVFDSQQKSVFWQLTIPNPQSGGVSGVNNGFLGPYVHYCASLRNGKHFYVLDSLTAASNSVTLYAYHDTATGVVADKVISLPVKGNAADTCQLGANNNYLYASTNTGSVFAINRTTYATSAAATAVNGPASSIISDPNYVAINQIEVTPVSGPVSTLLDVNNKIAGGAGGDVLAVGLGGLN